MIPEPLECAIAGQIGEISLPRPVGGGSVSTAVRVECDGKPLFLKFDAAAEADFFAVEAEGLRLLAAASCGARVPAVIAYGHSPAGGWLALEWLETSHTLGEVAGVLGAAVAILHRQRGPGWGWHRDGYIGPLRQNNGAAGSWADFWFTRRIEPQLRIARDRTGLDMRVKMAQLEARLPDLLAPAEAEGPSLLHGDLWSGNIIGTDAGPALVDPSCYFGHREVDLAMADLFGGFGDPFFEAYEAEWPLTIGFAVRRSAYQLYYLLVHVNLFGASYLAATERALGRVLSA